MRAYQAGGRAYIGKPGYDFDTDGSVIDPPAKMVFHVIANPFGFVFEWGWEPEDPAHDG